MIEIKRRCEFFDVCKYAAKMSRTCTHDAGGDYCCIYISLKKVEMKKKRDEKKMMHFDTMELVKELAQYNEKPTPSTGFTIVPQGKKEGRIKRDEEKTDRGLEEFGVIPRIVYLLDTPPFSAITIADPLGLDPTWTQQAVGICLRALQSSNMMQEIASIRPIEPATRLLRMLREEFKLHGVAICDSSDMFNQQLGRTIAKGRLWKHLKVMMRERKKR